MAIYEMWMEKEVMKLNYQAVQDTGKVADVIMDRQKSIIANLKEDNDHLKKVIDNNSDDYQRLHLEQQ